MTPVFCCGFECGLDGVHWTLSGGTISTISTATPISGSRSLVCAATANTSFASTVQTFSGGKYVIRLKVKFTTLPTSDGYIARFSGTSIGGVIFKAADSKLYPHVVTTDGATGFAVTTGVTYVIDFKLDSSTGTWSASLAVDGASPSAVSASATADTAAKALQVGTPSSNTFSYKIDDVLVSLTTADYPIGNGYVNHFVPTSDGTHNIAGTGDFAHGTAGTDITNSTTDAWTLVDDVPLPSGTPSTTDLIAAIAPPNATDYVECVLGPASGISTPTAAPRAVEVVVAVHQASTATGSYKVNLNDNGTVGLIKEQVTIAGVTSFQYATKQFATAPTGGAWTLSAGAGNFNNLRVRFYSADAAPDQYFDAIMVEAEFPPPSGDITVSATGVSATGAIGSATVQAAASVSPTGVSGTGAIGTVTVTIVTPVPVTGVSGTGAIGTGVATGTAVVLPTGVAGTGSIGTAVVSAGATVAATGVSATGAIGTVVASVVAVVSATGVSATGAIGTAVVSAGATVAATGVSATDGIGAATVSGSAATSVSGISATAGLGNVTVAAGAVVSVSGVSAAGTVGTVDATGSTGVTIDVTVAVDGVEASTSIGVATVQAGATIDATGVSATGWVSAATTSGTVAAPLVIWLNRAGRGPVSQFSGVGATSQLTAIEIASELTADIAQSDLSLAEATATLAPI